MFPLRVTNRRRVCMKESVSRLQLHSIWTALLDKHVDSGPYLLSSFFPSFIRKGPNMSTPQFVKGGSSIVLSVGRSAIFCSPSFPHNNRHLTHFPIKLLTIVLHWTTQNPLLLISLMVSPLPPWAVFWWHHSTINLVMQLSLVSISSPIFGWIFTEFCLTLELKIFLYLRIHATTLFILIQSDINDFNLSKIPSFIEMVWIFISLLTFGSSSCISFTGFCLGRWNSDFYRNSGQLNEKCRCFFFDLVNPCDAQPAGFIFDGA